MRKKYNFLFVLIVISFICWSSSDLRGENKKLNNPAIEKYKKIREVLFMVDTNLYDGRFLLANRDKLNLNHNQIEKIEDLILDYESYIIRYNAEIKIKELRFASYLKSERMDRKEMEKYIRAIGNEKTNMIVRYINYLLDIKKILTNSQLVYLYKFKKEKK